MVKLTGDEFDEDQATDSKDNEETSEATKARGKQNTHHAWWLERNEKKHYRAKSGVIQSVAFVA